MRASNLAEALVARGHRVVLWSADFNHFDLQHRFGQHTRVRVSEHLELRLVHSRGYRRNIGLGRLVDHGQLGIRMRSLLRDETPPDVAFVGFPPIEPAAVLLRWLKLRGVPSLVDVKDTWPDVLLRAVPESAEPVGRVALAGYYALASHAFRNASGVTSITDGFLDWTLKQANRPRGPWDGVFPLTTPRVNLTLEDEVDAGRWWDVRGVPDDGRFRAYFVGNLHSSYDFEPVVEAARRTQAQVVIGGEGSRASEIRQRMSGLPNVVMPGWVDSQQAEVLARRSSVALGPIAPHGDYQMSVPNKFYDAMAHGLPFLTGLTGAVGEVLNREHVGFSYGGDTGETLHGLLERLAASPDVLDGMAKRCTKLYDEQYSAESVYGDLVNLILDLHGSAGRSEDPVVAGD